MTNGDAINSERDGDVSSDIEWIPIATLVLTGSPRSVKDAEHAKVLAEVQSQAELPPIVVQRSSRRVIDGLHRVRAAQLRGEQRIRGRYFDGDDADAFVLAVRLNVRHGLPLSLADRKAAARHILHQYPGWSNRAVAVTSGLSPKTVGLLREQCQAPAVEVRIGRDGRRRPVSGAAGRERVREILMRDPTCSLRTVGAAAGVSPGTVRAIRTQLDRGAAVTLPRQHVPPSGPDGDRRPAGRPATRVAAERTGTILRALRSDPSLRFKESGRLLLSVLEVAAMDAPTQERLIGDLPEHCVPFVAELARASGQIWQELAQRLIARRSVEMT
ncbi:ParB N-terminal domain-containing protein [Paractinoplanes ferrugineus]|uniref:ParB-like N-terminal domain-containing protein n=1 Tax=Paractinoplanes ferrugineus TaxID=113564 RepID=A0A919J362_9ACTN|nr:ParB/RepB/Spo0J family partition protein [Actinoplanes ferrugineus]GIE13088.1 hypothetical protein Afe05nite_49280 [Actinoplanes ferrugineus]